ncbi:DNA-directed RNA polymerase subunit RPC12/RpoP [Phycisphaera mikurensis]|nr:DNA-directed RNA polymerase subunit RPC12/RpoP [Phycisphaera mikurensis]
MAAPSEPAAPQRLQMVCPNLRCRKMLSVPVIARGRTVRCRACSMRIHVPRAENPATAPG